MEEEQVKGLPDMLAALRRRKKQMISTAGLLLVITALVALFLPPVYRSTATILIEEQEIPQELVRSTITSYADERIQTISQRVMTRANLMQIIDKYDLYADRRRRDTTEEILDRMRKDIHFNMVSADVMDRVRGVKTSATIAFTLAYDSKSPEAAQKVASELVSLYLNENVKNRQQRAAETSNFLEEEAGRLSKHIEETEAKLADFKRRNIGRLPELEQLNLQLRDRADSELLEVDRRRTALEQQKFFLEGQLAQVKPNTPLISSSGERIPDADDRLKMLEAQYASLSGIYSPKHPDLVKMRREIDSLRAETGGHADPDEQAKQLTKLRTELATMRERYSDTHPDVVKLKHSIAALEEAQAKAAAEPPAPKMRKPENPAYLTLQAQLESVTSELKSLAAQREQLKAKLASYETRLEQTPGVEREYLDLTRDHENSVKQYQEIKAKQMEADVAQQLEKDSKGERFSLIDPPQLPEKPDSPNRPAIFLLGAILSLGGGLGYAGLRESLDTSVKSAKELPKLLPVPMLAAIPYMENSSDMQRRSRGKTKITVAVLAVLIAALLIVHFFVSPLDVLWYRFLRFLDI